MSLGAFNVTDGRLACFFFLSLYNEESNDCRDSADYEH